MNLPRPSAVWSLYIITFLSIVAAPARGATLLEIRGNQWFINAQPTYPNSKAEGLLLNVRMVNAVFEDRNRTDFNPEANTKEFTTQIPAYFAQGIRAFTLNLQGGAPGYEGALNSAFYPDGSLNDTYLGRVHQVITECDRHGAVVILGCFYQRQDQILQNEAAIRAAVVNVAKWIQASSYRNVLLEIANEYGHNGFDHPILKTAAGQVELIQLARQTSPGIPISTSGLGHGNVDDAVARASDYLLIHFNNTKLENIPNRIQALKKYDKPILCNEDQKIGEAGARALELCVENGASWGLMLEKTNQHFPFAFNGPADDPIVYDTFKKLTTPRFAAPLEAAFQDLRAAIDRGELPGAIALVARNGRLLRHEAIGYSDPENKIPFATNTLCWIASITKPVTAAAAMLLVQNGRLNLDDPIEKFLPEFRQQTDANGVHHPVTIRQLMSHTSGLVPNPPTRRSGWPIGGPLDDSWLQQNLPEIVQTIARSQLRFTPGSKFEYSNSAYFVLGRIIETISARPYSEYVQENIFKPLGISDTYYAPPPAASNRIAVITARRNQQPETIFRFKPNLTISNHAPDGGLFSYPAQLLSFMQLFLTQREFVFSRETINSMLTPQPHGWGLGWALDGDIFFHEGSSGTLAWADRVTGVTGILFTQFRDQEKSDERIRQKFRDAVTAAFKSPGEQTFYFPPPESKGGWRKLERPEEIEKLGRMDPAKLDSLKQWLLDSDKRNFAAVIIRNGYICLEVERGNSAKSDSRRVASVSKAICATVLAIASEQSQRGLTPRKMEFDDPAFQFIPWAQPLSDPRKEKITIRQLLNHTSGICPESTGAPNDGSWQYILGHTSDDRTAKLAFDPGSGCGYSTHAFAHAALVCENVTGQTYDQFAIASLCKPIDAENYWFQYYDGDAQHGRHPSHGLGMSARDLARIAYCMLREGRWRDQQVIPKWFVTETAAPTHNVTTPELRWKLNPKIFSHGWELPAHLTGENNRAGQGIPADARAKPGSGGQYIAFVPSLDLVITRQTGASGDWPYEEFLRRASAAVIQ